MDEYIKREDAIRLIEKLNPVDYGSIFSYEAHGAVGDCLREIRADLEEMTAADVKPVVRARWEPEPFESYIPIECDEEGTIKTHEYIMYRCSACGLKESQKWPYCHCGAQMEV